MLDIKNWIIQERESALQSIADRVKWHKWLEEYIIPLEGFTSSVDLNPNGGSLWINVYTREDLQIAMKLAQLWTKSGGEDSLKYRAEVDGYEVTIYARMDALPPTCKEVEEDILIPAQPERIEKRKKIVCDL